MHAYLVSYFKNLKKFTGKDKDNIYIYQNQFISDQEKLQV